MTLTRNEIKERRRAYRETARTKFSGAVRVPLNANVQPCEGGAFVEAVVWVGDDDLAAPRMPLYEAFLGANADAAIQVRRNGDSLTEIRLRELSPEFFSTEGGEELILRIRHLPAATILRLERA